MRPRRQSRAGFTLVEVLAALMLMAIIVPVTMHAMSVATRVGVVAQRKAAATRVADRMLNELILTGDAAAGSTSGTLVEGETTYAWSLESESWSEDAMLQLTLRVIFTVQGDSHETSVSTLIDPAAQPTDDAAGLDAGAGEPVE